MGGDGKRGFERKQYLEPKGMVMERAEGVKCEETWVSLNWKIGLPSRKTDSEFPLKSGLTPSQSLISVSPTKSASCAIPKASSRRQV